MTAEELISLRKSLGLTQAQMAAEIGLGPRAYSAIETEQSALRKLHALAVERASLRLALKAHQPMKAPESVRVDAAELYRQLNGPFNVFD